MSVWNCVGRLTVEMRVETIHEGQQDWPLKCGSCEFKTTQNLGHLKLHIFQHNYQQQQQQPKKITISQIFEKKR